MFRLFPSLFLYLCSFSSSTAVPMVLRFSPVHRLPVQTATPTEPVTISTSLLLRISGATFVAQFSGMFDPFLGLIIIG
jgi:hypothetical protein